MTKTKAREEATKKAAKGELSFLEALKKKSLDLWAKDHKKFLSASTASVGELLSLGLLHGTAQEVAIIILAVLGVGAVNQIKNVRPKAE